MAAMPCHAMPSCAEPPPESAAPRPFSLLSAHGPSSCQRKPAYICTYVVSSLCPSRLLGPTLADCFPLTPAYVYIIHATWYVRVCMYTIQHASGSYREHLLRISSITERLSNQGPDLNFSPTYLLTVKYPLCDIALGLFSVYSRHVVALA